MVSKSLNFTISREAVLPNAIIAILTAWPYVCTYVHIGQNIMQPPMEALILQIMYARIYTHTKLQ